MKKSMTVLTAILLFTVSFIAIGSLTGCAVSKAEISQATNQCDIMVEVRTLGRDSVSWFAGNTMYLNVNQTRKADLFPMFISIRNPNNIDMQRGIEQIATSWDLITFFKKDNWNAKNFGVVISDMIRNEIGIDEQGIINKLTTVFKQVEGSSLVIFYEKDGVVSDMKKVF